MNSLIYFFIFINSDNSRTKNGLSNVDLDKNAPKIRDGLDIHGPKIGLDVNTPKICGGLDIHCPKIGVISIDINAPKIEADFDIFMDLKMNYLMLILI